MKYTAILGAALLCSSLSAKAAVTVNALVIKGTGQTVVKNTCSAPLTIESVNLIKNIATPVALTSNTTVIVVGTNSVRFYKDAKCSSAISSTVIPKGESQVMVYFSDPASGTTTLRVRIGGAIADGTQVETIPATASSGGSGSGSGTGSGSGSGTTPSSPPAKLSVPASQTIALGDCVALPVTTTSSAGAAAKVTAATTINISGSSGDIKFFTDSACKTSDVRGVIIPVGQDAANIYLSGAKEGTYSLAVAASGYSAVNDKVTLTPATPPTCSGNQAPPTSPPGQAATAGFNNLVFDDEFNSADTISPNNTGNYNWYTFDPYSTSYELTPAQYDVQNGCLTILSDDSGFSDGLITVNSTTATAGTFQHGYFEARMQFNPQGSNSSAWPAFWTYAIEAFQSATTHFAELDILEAYPTGGTNGVTPITTLHEWTVNSGGNTSVQNSNNVPTLPAGFNLDGFHIYGVLWTPNSVTWYIDNAPVTTVATGPGTDFPSIENDHMAMILGTGKNWPVTYDYVHVWQ